MVNKWISALETRLLPGICIFCRGPAAGRTDLCDHCFAGLPTNAHPCPRCALPLPAGQRHCGRCLTDPGPVAKSFAPWLYGFPLDAVIGEIKHHRRQDYLQVLAQAWLKSFNAASTDLPDALVPVPLHWRRRLWRGFNQAEELALTIGNDIGIPVISITKRVRHTPPQQQLHARERHKNLRGAFALSGPKPAGLHLTIVDDVVTTGATTRQLAAIMRRGGAARVDVWCLARTP